MASIEYQEIDKSTRWIDEIVEWTWIGERVEYRWEIMDIARNTSSNQAIVTVAQHAHLVLAVRWKSLPFHWPCYAQVQRSSVIQDKSELLISVWILLIPKCVMGVRVQPARRPCGNPWSEETYGGLVQGFTSPAKGISDGEFTTSQVKCVYKTCARRSRGILERRALVSIHTFSWLGKTLCRILLLSD